MMRMRVWMSVELSLESGTQIAKRDEDSNDEDMLL